MREQKANCGSPFCVPAPSVLPAQSPPMLDRLATAGIACARRWHTFVVVVGRLRRVRGRGDRRRRADAGHRSRACRAQQRRPISRLRIVRPDRASRSLGRVATGLRRHRLVPHPFRPRRRRGSRRTARGLRRACLQQPAGPPQRCAGLQRRPDAGTGDAQLLAAAARRPAACAAARAGQRARLSRLRPSARARRVAPERGGLSRIELGLQSNAGAGRTPPSSLWGPKWIEASSLILIGLGCVLRRRRLAQHARGVLLVPRLALPGVGGADAGVARARPAVGQRSVRVHAVRVVGGAARARGPVLSQLRRPALAHDRKPGRAAMGAAAAIADPGRPRLAVRGRLLLVCRARPRADVRDGDLPRRHRGASDRRTSRRWRSAIAAGVLALFTELAAQIGSGRSAIGVGGADRHAAAVRGRRHSPVPDVRAGAAGDRGRPQPARHAAAATHRRLRPPRSSS